MKDKIVKKAYDKILQGFKSNFLPRGQFEKEFTHVSNKLLDTLNLLTNTYQRIKASENKSESSQVVKIGKDDFIIKRFNSNRHNYRSYSLSEYTIVNLEELKSKKEEDYKSFANDYEKRFENGDNDVVVPIAEYIGTQTSQFILTAEEENNSNHKDVLENLFWTFFHKTYTANDSERIYSLSSRKEALGSPENVIDKFKEHYLSNKYLKLLDKFEKAIEDETLLGFETYSVNIGKKFYESGKAGWGKLTFQVRNNGTKYVFSHTTKDENETEGESEFISTFIFQKNQLLKIIVTLDDAARTPFIIHRDCEKVSLKNDCEVIIDKHHGKETIILDTRKEALEFQTKLLEIRAGRNNR